MKAKLSRMLRSGVAMLLVLCMVAGFIPTAAFATEETAKKYVSLGDSMANGYGLEGYDDPYRVNGFLDDVADSYPAQIAKEYGWELTPMATSAMRAEDLHYILEYPNGFQGDYYTEDEFIDGRWNDYGDYGISEKSGVANVAKLFQTNVAEADVISLGIGNANFGVFMLGRITNAMGILGGDASKDAWIDFQDALSECDAETKAFALQAYEMLKEEVAKRTPAGAEEIVDPMVNAIAYTVTSYVLNYGGVIDAIAELNPDAEVIIVGLMNTFSGMKMSYEGQIIDLGAIMDKMISTVNAYLAALPATLQTAGKYPEATYYYAAASNVSMIVDNFATEIKQEGTVVRDRTIEEVVDMIWPMLNGMTEAAGDGSPYVEITRSDVQAYEAALADGPKAFAGYMAQNSGKVQSIATYLAFEKATIEASKLDVLDANAFITLANGLNGVFDGVYDAFYAKLMAETEENAQHMAFAKSVDAYLGDTGAYVETVYSLSALPGAMSSALTEDETVYSLLNLFARMLIGNGIGCHPSAAGHDTLTDAIIASYNAGHTVQDETIENVQILLNELYNLVETYGPEVAAQVWAQWEEYGYVDMVETSISQLKAMLTERYEYYTTVALPAIEKSVENLYAQKEALTAELAALKAELEAKQAELADVVNNVEIGDIHVPDINIDVELGDNDPIEVPEHECTVDGDSIEAELEAAVKDLEHAIAVIEALLADIEADIADMIALAEQIAAAVAELEKTMADVADAAKNLEEAVKAVIAVIENSDGVVDQTVKSFEAARDVAQAAVEVLKLTAGTAEEMMGDIDTMIQKIAADAEALYNKFMNDLPGCIDQIPDEAKMLIAGSVYAVQQAYEANKEQINAALKAELAKLAEEYGINEETIKAELAKLAEEYEINKAAVEAELDEIAAKITEEVNAKYAEIEADFNAQIEAKKAEAAEKLAELEAELKGYQAELEALADDVSEEVRAQLQAQIDRVTADIAAVNEDLACAIEHLKYAAGIAYDEIVAEVTKVYEETVAALEQKLAELKAAYEEAVEALEQKLAELKAAYDKAVDELIAAADKAIAELTEALNKQLEELGKLGEELADEINGILSAIRQELVDAQKAVEEILKGNLAAIEELKNALIEMGGEAIADAIDNLIDAVNNLIEEATTADLVIDDDFKYVAIGDGSAAPESYVEKLTAALNAEAAENGVDEIEMVNYAKSGNTVAAERANLSDVTGADLITVGFSNVEFLSKAIANAGAGAKMDWAAVVGAENVPYVDELLSKVAEEIAEAGIEGESAVMANAAIEAYAYAAVLYATELPELINEIHAVNPEALIIIVGMYNPMEGVTIALDANTTLDIGEYVDYLVKGVGVHGVAYSILTGNSIYVDAPAVQTVNSDTELGIMDMLNLIQTSFASLYPSDAGDDYIAAEIADALNITYVKSEPVGLWGDADGNGIVNTIDAMLVLQYYTGDITEADLNLAVCDVDGVNGVNTIDAMLILQYYTGAISTFPVEN